MKNIGKKKWIVFFLVLLLPLVICQTHAMAMEDKDVIKILSQNSSLFKKNGIVDSAFRFIGWGITKGIAALADVSSSLYDTCFGFIDFTKYKPVKEFINDWKPVFIALVCLSLLLIGILLCIGWEKKPKIAINLLIAVTVVSSSTYAINTLNKFISTEVREEILDGESSSVVYNTIGNNIHDLLWLDNTVGLEKLNKKTKGTKNAKKVYSSFSKSQFSNMDIQETLDPDDFEGDAEDILTYGLESEFDTNSASPVIKYYLDDLYDGVAWTDLLNEYYYRYTVDYGVLWMELLSLIIIYLFMSYKVIRILYEIVVHRLLAYLYSANLNNNQKVLKILDSLKDSYILLLMTTVMIKFYLLATKFVSAWEISGIAKGIILLFIAFAVIDGPNLVQKLTGADIGASDGMGKIMSMFYGGRMVAGVVGSAGSIVKKGAGTASSVFSKLKETMDNGDEPVPPPAETDLEEAGATAASDNVSNQQNDQSNDISSHKQEKNDLNQDNNQISHADIQENAGAHTENPSSDRNNTGEEFSNTNADTSEQSTVIPASDMNAGTGNENRTALSSEQGKRNGGYQMDSIGNTQSQNDALNGSSGGNSYGSAGTSMKQMERDLSNGNTHSGTSDLNNKPLDAGGKIFSVPHDTEKTKKGKELFENERGKP